MRNLRKQFCRAIGHLLGRAGIVGELCNSWALKPEGFLVEAFTLAKVVLGFRYDRSVARFRRLWQRCTINKSE